MLRQTLVRRQTFFDAIRALTRYMVFDSWHHLMDFMIRGLQLDSALEARAHSKLVPELTPKLDTS